MGQDFEERGGSSRALGKGDQKEVSAGYNSGGGKNITDY